MELYFIGLKEGLFNDIYYTREVILESCHQWVNAPVTIGHPANSKGKYIGINDDLDLYNQYTIGRINSIDCSQGDLRGTIWIHNSYYIDHINYYYENSNIGVSTGLFGFVNEGTNVLSKIIPDHLALLLNKMGACSLRDGCYALKKEINNKKVRSLKMDDIKKANEIKGDNILLTGQGGSGVPLSTTDQEKKNVIDNLLVNRVVELEKQQTQNPLHTLLNELQKNQHENGTQKTFNKESQVFTDINHMNHQENRANRFENKKNNQVFQNASLPIQKCGTCGHENPINQNNENDQDKEKEETLSTKNFQKEMKALLQEVKQEDAIEKEKLGYISLLNTHAGFEGLYKGIDLKKFDKGTLLKLCLNAFDGELNKLLEDRKKGGSVTNEMKMNYQGNVGNIGGYQEKRDSGVVKDNQGNQKVVMNTFNEKFKKYSRGKGFDENQLKGDKE